MDGLGRAIAGASLSAVVCVSALSTAVAAPTAGTVVRGTVTAKKLKNNGNIVVSLEAPGLVVKPPAAPVKMDQRAFQFIPHVLPIVRGTTVRFLNNDPEPHNVYSPEGRYNLGNWGPGETRDNVFDKPGIFTQLCKVHPDMLAFVVVLETPYFAVTDAAGRYEIKGVPPGQYRLVAWSEELDELARNVTVAATPLTVDLAYGS
jgi:plastocyanin